MPVWRRYLVKESTGRLVELPSRQYDRADDGTAPIPDYAGRCVELVSAVLVGKQGDAPTVTEVAFTKLYFDQSGFVDAAKRERMIRLMLESCADRRCRRPARRTGCTDCNALAERADAARSELMRDFEWAPAPAEVTAALFVLGPPGRAMPLH
ncbi:hypothetical protein ABAZ39_22245 (plasmid) [Azospirillum argentinense]|uniref:Uncharacterized protein n=1 Tax=Azospirillum argentinense TaxID=2970906 RepID=A0A060DPI1_9PROT|nr:hypothetical protein [Azospirillum argentinense]AIB14625.1 hypothetical protein ABAZ39_22245 [Azospirillum argentinense]EZQ05193.1 hypothetical protein ABAZ39_15910 [Azospirillum argentinense]MBK3800031.1 hypothetical protein [Azospirillum argentinense]PNQ99251.1 hypothetical protein C1S70_08695 [Azospirillum argentinense]